MGERRRAWTVCRFKRRLGEKEGRGMIPQYKLWVRWGWGILRNGRVLVMRGDDFEIGG